jgi:hypothetical protein
MMWDFKVIPIRNSEVGVKVTISRQKFKDGLTDRQTDGRRVNLKSPPVKPIGD